MSVIGVALGISAVLLVLAAALLLLRITIGPTILDRTIALDTLVAVLICGLATEAAWHQHTDTLPVIVVLTLVGFVGSVSVARFVPGSDDVDSEDAAGDDVRRGDGGWL